MDDHLDDDHCDPVVDGWMKILVKQKKLWFEELYNADMDGRKEENQSVVVSLGKRKRNGKGKEKEKEKEKKKEKEKEKEKKDECGESLRKIIEAGLKQIGDQMITLKTEVTEKLADLEKKMEYVFNYVPPMDVNSSKEKVVGEPSSAKEKTVAKEKEAQEVVKEKEVAKEKEVEEVPKEKDVEEVVKEKEVAKEKKKKRKSYSELVQGHFKRPKTRSNNHS